MIYFAIAVLASVVVTALLQPQIAGKPVRPHWAAAIGALVMMASGLVTPFEAGESLRFMVKPLTTLVSLMVMTLIADRIGLFVALTRWLARSAKGNAKRLFSYLFFGGTIVGALFTNDAAVLILTPLVATLMAEIATKSWGPRATLPYFFAVLYVANLVGLLVISNPINIVVAESFDISFLEYAKWMVLPALASIVVTYFGLRFYFRRDLPDTFVLAEQPKVPQTDVGFQRFTTAMLCLNLIGFFTQGLTQIPLHVIAAISAGVLALAYSRRASGDLIPIAKGVAWDVLLFVSAIFIVALGVRNSGLTAELGSTLQMLHEESLSLGIGTTSATAACLSALMNNHPVAYTMSLAIQDMTLSGDASKFHVFAALIGGDLGPKMLPIGSIAALLWFRLLRDRGIEVSYREYVKLGIPVTAIAVVAALAVLRLEIALF